jgi:hypothetical protein
MTGSLDENIQAFVTVGNLPSIHKDQILVNVPKILRCVYILTRLHVSG